MARAAVNFVQRFGNLNLHVHFHIVVPNGVFTRDAAAGVRFHPASDPTREELDAIVRRIEKRSVQSDTTASANVTAPLGSGTGHHIRGFVRRYLLTGNGCQGKMYLCGSSSNSTPTLQRLGFTNSGRSLASPFANPVGTMNAPVDSTILAVATANAECSPVTEFFNANAPVSARIRSFRRAEPGTGKQRWRRWLCDVRQRHRDTFRATPQARPACLSCAIA
jgi:hypothetical protein